MLARWFAVTFDALREREFRILWIGTSLSFLAFNMSWIVQSVVAFNLTGRNSDVGLVWLGMGVANVSMAPFGGVIADRFSKKRLLLIGQTIVTATFLAVGVLILTDRITIFFLVLSTFLTGVAFAFIGPARQAWIGQLLPKDKIANGVALNQVGMTATRVIGPMLAGVLIVLVGSGGTYLFMGGVFVIVVGSVVLLPSTPAAVRAVPTSVFGDMSAGFFHIKDRPRLRLLSLMFIAMAVSGFSYMVVFPGLLEYELNTDPDRISVLYTISAAAGFIVMVGVAGLAGSKYAWSLMLWGAALLGMGVALSGMMPTFVLLALVMVPMGIGMSVFQMLNNALIMRESDPAFFGRVMSLTMMAWGFNSLAGFPVGLAADEFGERAVMVGLGVISLAIAVVATSTHFAIRRSEPPAPVVVQQAAGGGGS